MVGTAGGMVIIAISNIIISAATSFAVARYTLRRDREAKTSDVIRESRSRLLLQLERLRFWDPSSGDEVAYDAVAKVRAIIAEEPTCVTDRGRARSAVEDVELNVNHSLRLEASARQLGMASEEDQARYVARGVGYKFAIENSCNAILELATPSDS
ncbi:hypothetical protein [Actinomycetospora chibensis]|uniref:Uncharacterized protein n=1 Tax=Actinomycetospora chibensis TaxID=663606 RepID=A0ABV9RFW9_9PSEU|nr:hypothetical protein [Actinomycetospora chibensis]MDD7925014.1 hypothetical protein [Actinomycetospora chibensis]